MVFGIWVEDAMARDGGKWWLKRASLDIGLLK